MLSLSHLVGNTWLPKLGSCSESFLATLLCFNISEPLGTLSPVDLEECEPPS